MLRPTAVTDAIPLTRDRRGVAAVEFALLASVLLLFVVGIVDIGTAIQQRMALEQAARAAGQYAVSFPNQTDGITRAVTMALPPGWTDVRMPSPPSVCFCGGNGAGASCEAVCSGGSGAYIVVQLQRPFSPFLFPTGNCVSSGTPANCVSYVVRIQ